MIPLFGKFTYLAAPAGGDSSAPPASGGPGEGNPNPQDGGSDGGSGDDGEGGGDDAPPDDGTGDDGEGDDHADPQDGQRSKKDNAIPYSRVKAMLQQERERATAAVRQEFDQRFQGFMQKFEERFGREPSESERENAIRTLLGKKPLPTEGEELNQPVTRADLVRLFQNQNQQITQAFQLRREEAEVESALTSARTQHADFFEDDPDLEDRLLALYRVSEEGVGMKDVIAKEISRLTKFAERRTANYARRKQTSGRVAPFGRGTAPRTSKGKEFDLAKPDQQDAAVDALLDQLEAEG
jgi:hypothetical protein